jgi:hypothetical protein
MCREIPCKVSAQELSTEEMLSGLQSSIQVKHQDLVHYIPKIPSEWKQANIIPVFRKGSKILVPNLLPSNISSAVPQGSIPGSIFLFIQGIVYSFFVRQRPS